MARVRYLKYGYFSSNGFARPSWGSNQSICIRMVETVKDLTLNGIEVVKVVEVLKLWVIQCRFWQGL